MCRAQSRRISFTVVGNLIWDALFIKYTVVYLPVEVKEDENDTNELRTYLQIKHFETDIARKALERHFNVQIVTVHGKRVENL